MSWGFSKRDVKEIFNSLEIHSIFSKPIESGSTKQSINSYAAGVALQFLNLKVILSGITIYLLYITKIFNDPTRIVILAVLWVAIGFFATSVWAFGGTVFRAYWEKQYRVYNLLMGGILIYLAVHSLINYF